MILDLYICECSQVFYVENGKAPNKCPFCGKEETIEWSQEVNIFP